MLERENRKLKGELKRRKTEGRTVIEMESEAGQLRKELQLVKATPGLDIEKGLGQRTKVFFLAMLFPIGFLWFPYNHLQ